MSDGNIKVALEAMRSDAAVWSTASDDLRAAISAVADLKLTGGEMSYFATEKGLDATYNYACTQVEDMLRNASEYFQKLSDTLESAAKQYEQDEANATSRVEQVHSGL